MVKCFTRKPCIKAKQNLHNTTTTMQSEMRDLEISEKKGKIAEGGNESFVVVKRLDVR